MRLIREVPQRDRRSAGDQIIVFYWVGYAVLLIASMVRL